MHPGSPEEGSPLAGEAGCSTGCWHVPPALLSPCLWPPRSSSPWRPSAQPPPRAGSSSCPSPVLLRTTGEHLPGKELGGVEAGGRRTRPSPRPCCCRGQLGALRLAVRLVEDRVLPQHYYQPLIQLLTEPILHPGQVGAAGWEDPRGPLAWGLHHAHPALRAVPRRHGPGCPGGGDLRGEPTGGGHQAGEDLLGAGAGHASPGLSHHPRAGQDQ